MKSLKVLNKQHQTVAAIQPNLVVQADDKSIQKELESLIQKAKQDGIPTPSGGLVERDGKQLLVEKQIIVRIDDDNFLPALADLISRSKFANERLFGLIEE